LQHWWTGIYLSYRFYNTQEFHDYELDDWLDNRKWFDVKFISDLIGDAQAPMHDDSYSSKLKAIIKQLGLLPYLPVTFCAWDESLVPSFLIC